MSFAQPAFLLALVLVPLAVLLYLWEEDRRRRQASAFASRRTIASALRSSPGWRRHVPIALYCVALALLAIALARPQATIAVDDERASVVLVMDRSGSMTATDVAPNRLVAARESANALIDRVPKRLRVGVIMFNQRAVVLEPPTTDRWAARDALGQITPRGGTATGEAMATALSLVRPGNKGTTPAAIVLLTDGASVRGRDPLDIARLARRLKVPVHTISLGTAAGVIRVPRANGRGVEVRPVPPDTASLRAIAQITGGEAFAATDAARLQSAFEKLGSQVGRKHEEREVTAAAAGGALLFILLGGAMALRWSGRFM